eukprot:TRINITY_DN8878_c0_g1_i14.p1 TRINITY_DN8878_c0_g1~~TRINITY_DN8878_c0_g1_i14.p1  ORF type:complete len:231 (-),score=71.61 TRINITY_DN8878_c0_g1_i14:171-863(-)
MKGEDTKSIWLESSPEKAGSSSVYCDSSERIKTDASYKSEERAEAPTPCKGKNLEEYLELVNSELADHMTLVEISLKRQSLQLDQNLTLKKMQIRRYKRKLKEQIIKSTQKSAMRQKMVSTFSEGKEMETNPVAAVASKHKLQAVLKHLQSDYDVEDEEEVIDLNEAPKNAEAINSIYNRKRAEINKVREGFKKVMENCKERNLHEKVIAKLRQKQIQTISQISDKFSKL